jgi:hypothetical protein
MSYPMSREQARADCKAADLQIDGNDASNTSPVFAGGSAEGAAPMEGEKMFTKSRTRPSFKGNQGSLRREFPSEGVSSKG